MIYFIEMHSIEIIKYRYYCNVCKFRYRFQTHAHASPSKIFRVLANNTSWLTQKLFRCRTWTEYFNFRNGDATFDHARLYVEPVALHLQKQLHLQTCRQQSVTFKCYNEVINGVPTRTVARKFSGGLDIIRLTKTPLIYSVSRLNLEGWSFVWGAKPTKAPRGDGTGSNYSGGLRITRHYLLESCAGRVNPRGLRISLCGQLSVEPKHVNLISSEIAKHVDVLKLFASIAYRTVGPQRI